MSHVQGAFGAMGAASGVTSASATFPAAVSSGDTVVGAVIITSATSTSISSITDDKGNSYPVIQTTSNGTSTFFAIFVLTNITNGPTTITVHFSPSVDYPQVICDEYTPTGAVDGQAGQYQTSVASGTNVLSSGTMTPTQSGDLLWAANVNMNVYTNLTAGTSFTLREQDTTAGDWGLTSEDRTVSGTSAVAGTFSTTTASNNWMTVAVLLKPAGSGTYTASLTESGSAADTVTVHAFTATASLSESVSAADIVIVASFVASAPLSEFGSATDATTVIAFTATATLPESGAATESLSLLPFLASLAESGAAADSPSVQSMVAALTLAEAVSAVDSQRGLMTAVLSLAEAGFATDAPSGGIGTYEILLNEVANAVHTLTAILWAVVTLTESGAAVDSPTGLMTATASLTDTELAADSPSGAMTATLALTEGGSATDSAGGNVLGNGILVSLDEVCNAVDTLSWLMTVLPIEGVGQAITAPPNAVLKADALNVLRARGFRVLLVPSDLTSKKD